MENNVSEKFININDSNQNHILPGKLFLFSIFLISFSVLALQLALVRIFSVMVWYHFTFMIISLALLGYGAAGSFLSVFKNKIFKSSTHNIFSMVCVFAGASLIITYVVICFFPPDPFSLLSNPQDDSHKNSIILRWIIFIIDYILLFLPFFLSGIVISGAVSFYPSQVSKIYFADLAGAGFGCLGMLFLLYFFGGERSVLICAVLFFVSAIFFYNSMKTHQRKNSLTNIIIVIGLLCSVAAIIFIPKFSKIPIAENKALAGVLKNPYQELLFTRWNAISRVDVFTTADRLLLWKVSRAFEGDLPQGKGLMIDADAFTPIAGDDGSLESKRILNYTITSLGYQFGNRNSALIIGPGGGMDVLTAEYNGIKDITGVELNPLVVKIVGDEFKDFNRNLYHRNNIKIFADEGRSFIHRSQKKYDIIQIPLVDTWAALASGAYSLSENYIYTVEAIEDYWNHLSENGILSIIRWRSTPPTGLLRLSGNTIKALSKYNVLQPERHIFISSDGNLTNFILKRSPFSEEEILSLKKLCEYYKYQIIYSPYIKGDVMPYIYVVGDRVSENLNQSSTQNVDMQIKNKDEETTAVAQFVSSLKNLKKGEFKTVYINPYYIYSSAAISKKLDLLLEKCRENGAIPLYYSGIDGINDFERFFMTKDKKEFCSNYPLNVSPTTDESPFFFQYFKFNFSDSDIGFMKKFNILGLNNILSQAGILAILSLFIIAFFFSAILILLPLIIGGRDALKYKGKWSLFLYFSCLGLAYIFIEISQIQRYILFLGQPVYSISIVLFTFLTSSGLGSAFSGYLPIPQKRKIIISVIAIFIIAIFYFFIQNKIFNLFLSLKFYLRVFISMVMLFPLGFFMGMLFPSGIRLVEQNNKSTLIPWLWAANGICSVLGSILSSFFAMQIGFSNLLLLAGAIYLLSVLSIKRLDDIG